MTDLVLGPLLRHVGPTDATIWVETDASCEVEVRAGEVTARGRTFSVGGHHYAIIVVQGLPIGSSTAYQIAIDGTDVWPVDGDRPPSVIRTLDPDGPVRVAFGSCREPGERGTHRGIDPDVLVGFADRLLEVSADRWPTILFLAGDQVYADETSPAMRAWIAQRRDPSRPPRYEVADFEE